MLIQEKDPTLMVWRNLSRPQQRKIVSFVWKLTVAGLVASSTAGISLVSWLFQWHGLFFSSNGLKKKQATHPKLQFLFHCDGYLNHSSARGRSILQSHLRTGRSFRVCKNAVTSQQVLKVYMAICV